MIDTTTNAFSVRNPDFELSPHTGMTKQHYIDLAKYVLGRAFKYVDSIETPISFPIHRTSWFSPTRPTGAIGQRTLRPWKEHLPWQDR